jgi:hypothetical protein
VHFPRFQHYGLVQRQATEFIIPTKENAEQDGIARPDRRGP